ncbi:Reverse transcriptase domain-containing protein [Mycena indigotica]|uniref:Reverse transcriptase domain-containing protein n=1 Tax=Mycena indigotica TaxID=2126181 RepID=A0A8H6W9A9_9AGAR|nr:Reverse transcriptase domain-containing protein [Mycena indigotica]KAF7303939.1 Reverse transcriptase domain-containing protein [Mycena indigotica]
MALLNHSLISLDPDFDPGVDRINPSDRKRRRPTSAGNGETVVDVGSTADVVAASVAPGKTSQESGVGVDATALAMALTNLCVCGACFSELNCVVCGAQRLPPSTPPWQQEMFRLLLWSQAQRRQWTTTLHCHLLVAPLSKQGESVAAHRSRTDANAGIMAKKLVALQSDVASRDVVITQRLQEVTLLSTELRVQSEGAKSSLDSMGRQVQDIQSNLTDVYTTLGASVRAGNALLTRVDNLTEKLDSVVAAMDRLSRLPAVSTASALPAATASLPQVATSSNPPITRSFNDAFPAAQVMGSIAPEPKSKKRNTSSAGPSAGNAPNNGRVDVLVAGVSKQGNALPLALGLVACFPSMAGIKRPVLSAVRAEGHDETISIRFNSHATAQTFLWKMLHEQPADARGQRMSASLAPVVTSDPWAKLRGDASGLAISCWNIHGNLPLKLTQADIVALIEANDVVAFLETWMRQEEEESLPIPDGYDVVVRSRADYEDGLQQHGGLVVVLKADLMFTVLEDLSTSEQIVLDFSYFYVVFAYLCPEGSDWEKWTDMDPKERIAEALAYCRVNRRKRCYWLGDLNCRTGSENTTTVVLPRSSVDVVLNTRGRWCLGLGGELDLVILNGSEYDADQPGKWTSCQAMGNSVIDYAWVCTDAVTQETKPKFVVSDKLRRWSDHAVISLFVNEEVDIVAMDYSADMYPQPPPRNNPDPHPELDALVDWALRSARSAEQQNIDFFGEVVVSTSALSVYIAAGSRDGEWIQSLVGYSSWVTRPQETELLECQGAKRKLVHY